MMSEPTTKRGWVGRLLGGGGSDIPAPPPEALSSAPSDPGVPGAPMPETPAPPSAPSSEPSGTGWLSRIRHGLSRSSTRLSQGIADLFVKRKLDAAALEELENLLITADLGVATAERAIARLAKSRFNQEVSAEEVRGALAEEIAQVLAPVALPLTLDPSHKPHVVLVVGVNGSGKTTTIGKLGKYFRDQGLSVIFAAGDTFRAAAVEQLKVWGERTGCPVIAREQGSDAAGLAFDALKEAQRRRDDLLLIDTAGRLQNKADLMAELQKIIRVLKKQDASAPHDVLLVLDATVGQNAHNQVDVFKEMTTVSGLVLTKLDGTAKGGVLVALAERFKLPVCAIGVGEGADDLRPFEATTFARSLLGLD
jgi:fused signal recognition particle receptor